MVGKRVFVYRNLRTGTWSVKDLKTGRVIAHPDSIRLKDCTLKVSIAGRDRVRREGRKNVHAGVVGTVTDRKLFVKTAVGMTYNPYKCDQFEPVVPEFLMMVRKKLMASTEFSKCKMVPTATSYIKRGQICLDADYVVMNVCAVNPVFACWL